MIIYESEGLIKNVGFSSDDDEYDLRVYIVSGTGSLAFLSSSIFSVT